MNKGRGFIALFAVLASSLTAASAQADPISVATTVAIWSATAATAVGASAAVISAAFYIGGLVAYIATLMAISYGLSYATQKLFGFTPGGLRRSLPLHNKTPK